MTSPKQITVVLADDHAVVRQGLCSLLLSDGRFRIVGEARNGREAVEMARTLRPDVILMDIAMPTLNGAEATRQIVAENPKAKVLVLSAHGDDVYVERMTELGAVGFLEKQTSADVLTKAIAAVAKGKKFYSPAIAKRLSENRRHRIDRTGGTVHKPNTLTSRESEVLQLVAEGAANKQVASKLGISIKTVEKHRQHLMDKLRIHDTAGLTRYAIAEGVTESAARLTIV